MTLVWAAIALLVATTAAIQALLLRRHRHLWPTAPASRAPAPAEAAASTTDALRAEAGVLYVDHDGHCTLADGGARELLHLGPGAITLRDLLPGGTDESLELLQALARQGVVERQGTRLRGAPALDIRAVAVRDRDDNFWGAALFLQCANPPPTTRPPR